MIVCKLELWPGGIEEDKRLLGEIKITNNLASSLETHGKRGTYDALIYKKRRTPWKRVKVKNFPRLSYHPWNLIREILNKAAEQNGGRL